MAIQPHSSFELEPWNDLNGKVVMVTGASAGLGYELCLDLARAGCKIIAVARRIERLRSLCDEINRLDSVASSSLFTTSNSSVETLESRRAVALEFDVSADGKSIEKCVRKAWDSFGFIDALINNAGIRGAVKSPLNLSEDEWNETVNTNLRGSWLVSKYVCIHMRDTNRGGSIINISSISGLNRGLQRGALAYCTSKAALNTLTKVMAMELGTHKIRVNSISPGLFKSEITKDLMEKDWLKNVARRIIPLQTFGTSDPALTTLVRYLVHDSSEYISGNIFIVDAGTTLPGAVKSPLNLSEDEWNETVNTNFRGSWLVSKYVCIHMRDTNRGGSIINISSISGLNRGLQRGALAYCTSKAALNTLTKVMAMELGKHRIRVNSICPGLFKSEITQELMEKDWLKNVEKGMVPLRTFGTSDPALTTLVRYLVHGSSGYVSGNIFIADAGTSVPGVPIFSSL